MVGKRWRKRIDLNSSEFSGFEYQSIAFCGILANASLFGAKTVNDPSWSSVSSKFAVLTSLTRVDKELMPSAAAAIVGRLETGLYKMIIY